MQSFLQYRRAGRAADEQIRRDLRQSGYKKDEEKTTSQDISSPEQSSPEADLGENDIERVLTGVHVQPDVNAASGQSVFIVDWDGPEDPLNPRNWTTLKRAAVTLQISMIALFVGSASGIDATVLPQAAADLHVSEVAESLATGLYLVGMGVGSLIAGPFSETFGRNSVYVISMAVFLVWIMASALAPNFGAQIVFRFLAGCSASTPLACAGGSVADMFSSLEKTWGFPLYAIVCFGGPMLGAVMGAYIGPSDAVTWRWAEWTSLISSGLITLLIGLFMPETYAPLLLQWKAAHYRKITGDSRFRSAHEVENETLFTRLKISMTRPFLMITEPIIIAMTLYITVAYIILFTFLVGWPFIFERELGLDQGLANVVFISMYVGTSSCFILVPIIYRMTMAHIKKSESNGSTHFKPEIRLWYAMFGPALAIPISLFWLAWTSFPSISVWSSIIAVALFGFGIMGLFLVVYMYIIDSYESFSASALTFVVLVRYVVSGGMTVAGIPFYENMGVHYTLTILACLAAALVPIPYVLYYKGHLLRARSKYAVTSFEHDGVRPEGQIEGDV